MGLEEYNGFQSMQVVKGYTGGFGVYKGLIEIHEV